MTRNFVWFAAGGIATVVVCCLAGLMFLKTAANGFSARSEPSYVETFAAQQARGMAMPPRAKDRPNPVGNNKEVLEDAMGHWADHCAMCHGNDGSGQVDMGRQMYPHSPDMRKKATQKLTDGELFYIIENGIRLSGMPGWGGSTAGETDSWKLVSFIRHLPTLSASEIAQMEKLNPKTPEDQKQEQEEEHFLNGQMTNETTKQHKYQKEK